jgi:hypothetical protein
MKLLIQAFHLVLFGLAAAESAARFEDEKIVPFFPARGPVGSNYCDCGLEMTAALSRRACIAPDKHEGASVCRDVTSTEAGTGKTTLRLDKAN